MRYCFENKIWNDNAHSGIGHNTTFLSYYPFIELGSFQHSHPHFVCFFPNEFHENMKSKNYDI